MTARKLISLREAARQLGYKSLSTLQHHIKAGHVTLIDGKIDIEVARIQLARYVDPDQSMRARGRIGASMEHTSAPGEESVASWIERRTRAEALRAELELQLRAGALVDSNAADRKMGKFLALLAAQLETIPDRLAAEFGVDDDHRRALRARAVEFINRARTEAVVGSRDDHADDERAAA